MERAVFVVESDNCRIPCLLNPETLTMQRTAGVRVRASSSGPIVLDGSSYDPLLYTDGGRTELTLDLLFDVSLVSEMAPDSTPDSIAALSIEDVRDLTRPLIVLAQGSVRDPGKPAALARFIWGKAWNLRGVVLALAERLEYFTNAGVPRRSWLRMRFAIVPEEGKQVLSGKAAGLQLPAILDPEKNIDPDEIASHFTLNDNVTSSGEPSAERLDEIAASHYGDPSLWRLIASFNHIDDPLGDLSGRILQIPPASAAETVI